MKILAICMEDPEWILGGMGMHVRELYREMSKFADIDLLTIGPGEGVKLYCGFKKHVNDKYVLYKPRVSGMSSLLIADISILKTFMKLQATDKSWDVLHVHEWNSLQAGIAIRDALGIPMIGTMHLCITALSKFGGDLPPEETIYLWQQEGRLVYEPDEFIICSHAYRKMIRRVFMTERPINMIYNGIDTEIWYPGAGSQYRAEQKYKFAARPIALFVGRIAEMKGIVPILDSVEYSDNGYQIVLSGEVNANTEEAKEGWEITKRIRRLCEYYPERICWIGFNHGRDLLDLYDLADVVLMPSIHEPFGLVALEAMACGVPLIATDADGLGEIVIDESGNEYAMIIQPHEINEALSMLKSDKLKRELIDLGLQRVRNFTWGRAAQKTLAIYHNTLKMRATA